MLGCLADGSVLTGGNSLGEQVFEGMMGWAWEELTGDLGEMGWQRSLLGSPPISSSPRMRQQAHHPQASQNPDGSERKNMGFLEGAGAIWITPPPPSSSLTGQPPLGTHSNRVHREQKGAVCAPELASPAGGRRRASHPPGCLVLTQPPGTNNPPR